MDSWSGTTVPRLPGTGAAARAVRLGPAGRRPARPGPAPATMYVCGITPYDATHLGHAATMITFDLVNRVWRDAGHDVRYVQNVTDIDDPLLERADRDGEDWIVLAMRETALFREDMEALRIIPPAHYVGAVESIPAIAAKVSDAARRRRRVPAGRRHRRRLLRHRGRARASATSPTCPASRCWRSSPSAAATRSGPASATRSTRCCGAAPATASRPGTAATLGPRPPRLAHRVRGDRAEPARRHRSTCRAAATTCSSRTTSAPPRTPRCSPARRRSPGTTCTPA